VIVSPLKDPHNFACASALKKIIPKGGTVNVPLFFAGHLELSLTSSGRRVRALTNKYVVYEFWKCAFHDPHRIIKISQFLFERRDSNMLYFLQEDWPTYRDPYLRSSLFFLLNRLSESGYQSQGSLNYDNYNPIATSRLKKLSSQNLTLDLLSEENFLEPLQSRPQEEYILIPAANFSYNLLEHGKSQGWESTLINHQHLRDFLKETDKRTVIVYKAHGALGKFFEDFDKLYLTQYGIPTQDPSQAAEVLIANFRIT